MFNNQHQYSVVTAVLPNASANLVTSHIFKDEGTHALMWKARGTLLHDHWWKRWIPPISPAKSMMQMLVPNTEVTHVVSNIVEHSRLHQQATGAVYSTPCDNVYLGADFHTWTQPPIEKAHHLMSDQLNKHRPGSDHKLTKNLSAIFCIVGHQYSDRVSRAAINAGAHGPIVYYIEGRGLRDRLGWLRITKEHEKEVLMIITDESDADEVFDAMAKAGQLHLPGRGFMYRMAIDKGMYNLPARMSHHHYEANMQQIIHAIDHINGHTHWRDQSVFNVGGNGRGVGLEGLQQPTAELKDQVSLSAICSRSHGDQLMNMMLDSGAPGVNVSYARFVQGEISDQSTEQLSGARLNEEYGMFRCITAESVAQKICSTVETEADSSGLTDLCMFVNKVPRVATYVPSKIDYRQAEVQQSA